MENIIIVTQARIGSTRFPGKVLEKIGDLTLLDIHINSIKRCKYHSRVIIASTYEDGIGAIEKIAINQNVDFFKGSTDDVLDRFYQAVINEKPDYIVRLTSDCPLIDSNLLDDVIKMTIENNLDYASNTLLELYPDGQDIEVFTFSTLEKAWKEAKLPSEREHVTPFMRKNSDFNGGSLFKAMNFNNSSNYNNIRMTVDEKKDLDAIKLLINKIGFYSDWKTYADFIINNPLLFDNQKIVRNEGYLNSIKKEI